MSLGNGMDLGGKLGLGGGTIIGLVLVIAAFDGLQDGVEWMRRALQRMKLVVEPTACLGMAAALVATPPGARAGVLVSGGNVDTAALCDFTREAA